MIKKIILSCLTLLFLIHPSFGDVEQDLRDLINRKKDLSGEEFYDELSEFQDQWAIEMITQVQETDEKDSELKEMKANSGIAYALDFKCLNDCKIYKPYDMCKTVCMVPKILIDNSSLW